MIPVYVQPTREGGVDPRRRQIEFLSAGQGIEIAATWRLPHGGAMSGFLVCGPSTNVDQVRQAIVLSEPAPIGSPTMKLVGRPRSWLSSRGEKKKKINLLRRGKKPVTFLVSASSGNHCRPPPRRRRGCRPWPSPFTRYAGVRTVRHAERTTRDEPDAVHYYVRPGRPATVDAVVKVLGEGEEAKEPGLGLVLAG